MANYVFHIVSAKYSSIACRASAGLDLISEIHQTAKEKRVLRFSTVPSLYYRVHNEYLAQQGLPLKLALHQTYQSVRSLGRGMTPVLVGQVLNATWKSDPQNTNLSPINGQGS